MFHGCECLVNGAKKKIEIENSGLDKFKCSDSSTKMSCKSSKASRTTFHCCCIASSVFGVFTVAPKRRIQKVVFFRVYLQVEGRKWVLAKGRKTVQTNS